MSFMLQLLFTCRVIWRDSRIQKARAGHAQVIQDCVAARMWIELAGDAPLPSFPTLWTNFVARHKLVHYPRTAEPAS